MLQLSNEDKTRLKHQAEQDVQAVVTYLEDVISKYSNLEKQELEKVPELAGLDFDVLEPGSEVLVVTFFKIKNFKERAESMQFIKSSPYFIRLEVEWEDTKEKQILYFSKHSLIEKDIYNWVTPIATLRYADIGQASYKKPTGQERKCRVLRKDNYLITSSEIVFMSHQDVLHERQVVYQKHFNERKEFMLPEVVAELDRLQDEIIRQDPHGHFLISGPAGSGKTTSALHRIAYLVLTPELAEFFKPEKIMVFVTDQGAVNYFSKLLPELGINNIKITTFLDWATVIINSRYKAKVKNRFHLQKINDALAFVTENNPIPKLAPRLVLDEYRKLKQEAFTALELKEGGQSIIYKELHKLYLEMSLGIKDSLYAGFKAYLQWQKKNMYLDEADITIIMHSLENPLTPFAHVVIDEVQNWTEHQLSLITKLVNRTYNCVTFVGDIQQKTRPFSINSWSQISETQPKKIELLRVYRNTRQIVEHLYSLGYDVQISDNLRPGQPVEVLEDKLELEDLEKLIDKLEADLGKVQIGILSKYAADLDKLMSVSYQKDNRHILTIEQSQGLEFDVVIILNSTQLQETAEDYVPLVGYISAEEYAASNKFLYYVAATRAKQRLIVAK